MVEAMEIQKGFKKTEVGLIPADWDLKNIIENSTLKARIGWQGLTVAEYLNKGDYFLITGTDFVDGKIKWDTCHYVNKIRYAQDKNIQVKIGDILITKDGTIGKVAYVDRLPLNATLNSGVFVIRPKGNIYLPLFLFYIFNSFYFRDFLNNLVAGSTIIHLYQKDFVSFSFPLPPTKAEQTAIAEALNDADALIAELEKLIAKKKAIKQGAMQELLKPKDGWEVKKLGDVLKVRHGKSQKEVAADNGAYPILASGGVIGRAQAFLYNKPSVLIGRKGTIDEPQYMDTPFWSVDTLFYTEIYHGYNAKFIFYMFNLIDWYSYNEASGVPSLNAKTIELIEKQFPAYEIQTHIAQILSDMDTEIEALEKKLDKYKMLKQGMMQNLLTGKIRLV